MTFPLLSMLVRVVLVGTLLSPGVSQSTQKVTPPSDLLIARQFAPIFYQALGDKPHSDYITNFDFDGDWRGDNNWNNSANKDFPLKAHIYYSIAETATHYFIHYAVFHPRDYKGGERKGAILSELIREGAKRGGKYDPTGLADEATLAHENDMEGALVVVKKENNVLADAQVIFVETLRHNSFAHYQTGDPVAGTQSIKLDGQQPVLYVEPKGHGIEAFTREQKQVANKDFLKYVAGELAADPDTVNATCRISETTACQPVSYDLLPLTSLWAKAKANEKTTYGASFDYGEVKLSLKLPGSKQSEKTIKIGKAGCAFLGGVGGVNMARPPWGWFDRDQKERPLGQWFFDPAKTIKQDYKLESGFQTTYIRLPFWAQ